VFHVQCATGVGSSTFSDRARITSQKRFLPNIFVTRAWPEDVHVVSQTKGERDWGFCMETCMAEKLRIPDLLNVLHGGDDVTFSCALLQEVVLETYNETSCHKGLVDTQLELCVGGRLNKPIVGIFHKRPNGRYDLVGRKGGGPYNFIGYKVR